MKGNHEATKGHSDYEDFVSTIDENSLFIRAGESKREDIVLLSGGIHKGPKVQPLHTEGGAYMELTARWSDKDENDYMI